MSTRNLYTDVYSDIVHNKPNQAKLKCCWTGEQQITLWCIMQRTTSQQQKQLTATTWINPQTLCRLKETRCKKFLLYDSISMKHSENTISQVQKLNWLPEVGGKNGDSQQTEMKDIFWVTDMFENWMVALVEQLFKFAKKSCNCTGKTD